MPVFATISLLLRITVHSMLSIFDPVLRVV